MTTHLDLPYPAPALTLWQPWAEAMLPWDDGVVDIPAKHHETRSWPAPKAWIGQRVCIHAAAKPNPGLRAVQLDRYGIPLVELMEERWGVGWPLKLAHGAVVGVGTLSKCFQIRSMADAFGIADAEFGNWAPGRWAWRFDNVVRLPTAYYCKGQQGAWYLQPRDRADIIIALAHAARLAGGSA